MLYFKEKIKRKQRFYVNFGGETMKIIVGLRKSWKRI